MYWDQCISNVNFMVPNQDFICICPKRFTGNRCEIADNKLIISFEKDIIVSQDIFIHFIDMISMKKSIEFAGRETILEEFLFKKIQSLFIGQNNFILFLLNFSMKIII
jgi:hypothetical protein